VLVPGSDGLGDAGDRVVIGQGEQLDTGVGGPGHHIGGAEDTVGVGRVRLQVEAGRHARKRTRSTA
jgi:hypothetical protein